MEYRTKPVYVLRRFFKTQEPFSIQAGVNVSHAVSVWPVCGLPRTALDTDTGIHAARGVHATSAIRARVAGPPEAMHV